MHPTAPRLSTAPTHSGGLRRATALRTSRRVWAGLAIAALFTSLAGVAALPASAAEQQAPVITNPFDGVVIHDVPSIDGTGEPGSTATITDGAGATVCSAPIDEFGTFSCAGTQLLPAGPNTLTVTATSPDGTSTVGNTVTVEAVLAISMSYPEPGSLVSTEPSFSGVALPNVDVQLLTAAGLPVCTTISDEWGTFECLPTEALPLGQLTLTPAMTVLGSVVMGDPVSWTVIAAPVILTPATGATVGTLPVFSGTAEPGTDIAIMHGRSGAVLCSAKVAQDGTYTCSVERPVMLGELLAFPMTSANGVGAVPGALITVTIAATQETPIPSPVPNPNTGPTPPVSSAPSTSSTTAPGASLAPAATPSAGSGDRNSPHLAATGASHLAASAAVGALLLLGGAGALVAGFRRRTRS